MGLDITAYRKISKIDAVFNEDGEPLDPSTREPIDDYYKAFVNPSFPGRAEGIDDGAAYSYEDSDRVLSLSYGGYNRWRDDLAKLAGYPLTKYQRAHGVTGESHAAACWEGATGPFSDLINFADNEGDIGPVVAAKLARDFAEWDERAKAVDDPYFYKTFCMLRRGVDMAADGGALSFH